MSEPNLFEQEENFIQHAERLLNEGKLDPEGSDYRELLKQYTKLFKHFNRVVKLNDRQQNALKTSEDSLKDEIEKRSTVEARLRENETQLVAAKEVAEQALLDKARFFASMSHEIRTPLNGVLGSAQLLNASSLSPEQREHIDTIIASGNILMVVINDLLDLSKIESGNLKLESTPMDLEELVEQVIDLLALSATDKGLELFFYLPYLERQIIGDPTRLSQVLVNLVNNAIKFTSQGQIGVRAQLQEGKDGMGEILFCIEDSGIGIPHDRLKLLFQAFTQADASTTRKFGGTGLGLSICQSLVELWDGKIWVESEEGGGSKFFFTLPLQLSDLPVRPQPKLTELPNKKVLVSFGNPLLTDKISDFLLHAGADVLTAFDLEEAKLQAKKIPDLMILDWNCPCALGWELHRELTDTMGQSVPTLYGISKRTPLKGEVPSNFQGSLLHKPIKRLPLLLASEKCLKGENYEEREDTSTQVEYEFLADNYPLRILIAEDNLINQKIAIGSFEILGYRVDMAADGAIALQMVQENSYDMVFMDMLMPNMDGLEATAQILALNQSPCPIIIAMTANASQTDVDSCLDAGMMAHVPKPIIIERLIDAIKNLAPRNLQGSQRAETNITNTQSEAAQGMDGEIFDLVLVKSLKDTYPIELLEELSAYYAQELLDSLQLLQNQITKGEMDPARRTAHKMKGSSINLGIKKIADLFSLIEMETANNQDADLQKHMDKIHQIKDQAIVGLKMLHQ